MSRGAFRGWAAIAASVAVCLMSAAAAPSALGGTIWVTDGAGSCNAFSVYANPACSLSPRAARCRSRWAMRSRWERTPTG